MKCVVCNKNIKWLETFVKIRDDYDWDYSCIKSHVDMDESVICEDCNQKRVALNMHPSCFLKTFVKVNKK
jgi:hypothetical protein